MADLGLLTKICWERPQYSLLVQAYQSYRADSKPCKYSYSDGRRVEHQCAVRLSVALVRSGFTLDAFTPRKRVHHNRPRCRLAIPHVLAAQELADYLRRVWRQPEVLRGRRGTLTGSVARFTGRPGVIYFNDCFTRSGGASWGGDHIDLWTGQQYFNQVIGRNARDEAMRPGETLFAHADEVWFFPL